MVTCPALDGSRTRLEGVTLAFFMSCRPGVSFLRSAGRMKGNMYIHMGLMNEPPPACSPQGIRVSSATPNTVSSVKSRRYCTCVGGVKKTRGRPCSSVSVRRGSSGVLGFPACWMADAAAKLRTCDNHYTPNTPGPGMAMRALSILAMAVDLACMASVPGDTSHFDKSN